MAASRRALIMTAEKYEDLEVHVPLIRLKEAGWQVDVAAPKVGTVQGEHGYPVEATLAIADANPDDYQLLVLPGGPKEGGAGIVRDEPNAQRIVQAFMQAKRPVAAICHGPYTLVSAGVLEGKRVTSVPKDGVPDEIREAGAEWVDEEVVVDGNLVTSRTPRDLPAFLRAMMQLVGDIHGGKIATNLETGPRDLRGQRPPRNLPARAGMTEATNETTRI